METSNSQLVPQCGNELHSGNGQKKVLAVKVIR